MKLAVCGKGGVGKTTIAAWLGDYLARQGNYVWLVDADTALSLGMAIGLSEEEIPEPLIENKELIKQRVGTNGFINLNPEVEDLPARLKKSIRGMQLLVMGSITNAGGGCACAANSLLKSLLAHLLIDFNQWVVVDLEAGVEHLGRGTISHVDGLVVVSEPSYRSLNTAANISKLATDLGLTKQALVLNRANQNLKLPSQLSTLKHITSFPVLPSLTKRQLTSPSVLNLPEQDQIDALCQKIITYFN